jgi:hypothetical protein
MKTMIYGAFALALLGGVADAQNARNGRAAGTVAVREDPADSLYKLGRQAGIDGEYRRSATLLKQLVDKYPTSTKAGDALYWRAWALLKAGVDRRNKTDLNDALDAIDIQQREYANSSTAADGRSLRAQIRSAQANLGDSEAAGDIATRAKGLSQARACTGSRADEEMRIAALEGLLNMNSDDAVPILKDVLKQRDDCRVELRKKAVWLISQKRGNDIAQTLLDVARNDPNADVRGDAVFWLSQTRSEQAVPLLDSILFTAGDQEIRKKALFSLSQLARDERARQSLRRAAEDERMSEEIRSDAIFWLGQSRIADLEYFRTLYGKTRSTDLKKKIVFSVSQTNLPAATQWLLDLAKDKSLEMDVRKDAIFFVSQRRSMDFDQLSTIYDQAKGEDEMQEHILFVFSQRREPAAVDKLMAVAKSDASIEMRKKALFWLGQKNDPRVRQFLKDLINK